MTRRSFSVALVFATMLAAPGAPGAEPATVRAVVTAGQPAPGGGSFERFSIELLPIIAPVNGRDQVAFFATLLRGPATEGLFLAAGPRIARVAVEGDRIPGGGAISGFGRHPIPALNASGTVAFVAAVAGGKTVEGVFTSSRGKLQVIALAGTVAPDIPSGTIASLDSPALNDRGDVAFLATVRRGRETVEAVYLRSGGRLRKVAAQGDPAPAGGIFGGFGSPALNNRGAVAFAAVVEGRGVPGGIFVSEAGQVQMLVGAGDDTPIGGIFAKFSERVAFNDAGTVAVHAILKGAPAPAAVLSIESGRARKVAAIGDPAPDGGTFSHFGLWPAISAAGAVGFTASVDGGPSPMGIFVADGSRLVRAVAVGDSLPGGGRLATLTLYPVIAMSSTGSLSFAAAPTATGEGAEGLYLVASGRAP